MITFKLNNLEDNAPLYLKYSRQCNPQPAYVEMDERGVVTADSDGNIGGGMSFNVYHGRTLRWGVNCCVNGYELKQTLEVNVDLLQRIHDGQEIYWDGNNNRGKLTQDAQEASDALQNILNEVICTEVWEVWEWICNCHLDDLWLVGESLTDAVTRLENDTSSDGIEIDGDISRALLDKAWAESQNGRLTRKDIIDCLILDAERFRLTKP